MDGYVNVVERKMEDLIKICIQERKSRGFGVLFLNFTVNVMLPESDFINTFSGIDYYSTISNNNIEFSGRFETDCNNPASSNFGPKLTTDISIFNSEAIV